MISNSNHNMQTVEEQALLGAFVADIASVPLHWHYDVPKLKEILSKAGRLERPEFFQPMQTQFYSTKDYPGHYDFGQLSVYGEQAEMMLDYFESTKGKFEGGEHFSQFLYTYFKAHKGYFDHPTKEFMKNAEKLKGEGKPLYPEAGADDTQTMHSFKLPVVALRLLNSEDEYLQACEEATRAHQNTKRCSDFGRAFAILMKRLKEGKSLPDILDSMISGKDKENTVSEEVKEMLTYTVKNLETPELDEEGWDKKFQDFGKKISHFLFEKYRTPESNEKYKDFFGLTCNFPGAFMVALKVVLETLRRYPKSSDFKESAFLFAVRRNIVFGGDNCGRSFLVGSLLVYAGAKVDEDLVKLVKPELLEELLRKIRLVKKY